MALRQSWPSPLSDLILALNAGSSSLKFGLFRHGAVAAPEQVALGVARLEATSGYQVNILDLDGKPLSEDWRAADVGEFVPSLLDWIERQDVGTLTAVGHRIVHGGIDFREPAVIDDRTLDQLHRLVALAPLHQPACLEPVGLLRKLHPGLGQVACFDTAFHRTIEPPASRFGLQRKLEAQGIRRFGFHGLSFQSIAAQLLADEGPAVTGERIIVAHLGNGASLCALRNLQSVDTTMGFSTLDGLVMGTRPGSLDPGVLLYLMKEQGYSADHLEQLLYRESGLLGVSGISSDAEILLASDYPEARDALELFAFQVARHAGAIAATLGGLDRFVFTGGIGANSAAVRAMIVDRLSLFGAKLEPSANSAGERVISSDASAILVERRETEEELAIARAVCNSIRHEVDLDSRSA